MSIISMPHWNRFVGIVMLIGVVYAVIVALVSTLVSTETAAIVGSALSVMLCTALTKLELPSTEEAAPQSRTPMSATLKSTGLWFFFALTLATIGLQTILGFVAGMAIASVYAVPDPEILQVLIAMYELFHTLTTPIALIGLVALNCLAYLMGGFLCGKIAARVRYGRCTQCCSVPPRELAIGSFWCRAVWPVCAFVRVGGVGGDTARLEKAIH